jgi:hypothetical protein
MSTWSEVEGDGSPGEGRKSLEGGEGGRMGPRQKTENLGVCPGVPNGLSFICTLLPHIQE